MFSLMPWRRETLPARPLFSRRENPFRLMRHEFESLFNRLLGEWPLPLPEPEWGFEMEESEKEYLLKVEVPGFEVPELTVEVRGEVLLVRAEHKEPPKEAKGEAKEVKEAETRYAKFERSLTLPPGTDTEKVEARYHNGVLEIHLPKTPEAVGRRIEVKV